MRSADRGGGHYMAYVRRRQQQPRRSARLADAADGDEARAPFSDEWLWFSDQCCGLVSEEEVAAAEPYICFYERV